MISEGSSHDQRHRCFGISGKAEHDGTEDMEEQNCLSDNGQEAKEERREQGPSVSFQRHTQPPNFVVLSSS